MSVTLVLGTQWGDEGKGKMVDLLAGSADLVVRYGGGANAGHTIVADGQTFKFHLIPSGAVREGKTVALGNGMVVDPETLRREMEDLRAWGKDTSRIFISDRAHVILPVHKALDALEEAFKASMAGTGSAVGTTRRGIGPAYADKMRRTGIRVCDVMADDEEALRSKLALQTAYLGSLLEHMMETAPQGTGAAGSDRKHPSGGSAGRRPNAGGPSGASSGTGPDDGGPGAGPSSAGPSRQEIESSLDVDSLMALCREYRGWFRGRVTDVSLLVDRVRREGGEVLLEGAQGTMLDIDHGTYPYVTSSNCTAGGACTGAGIGPRHIDRVLGVVKAYTTRVGGGPMPTELTDATGHHMQEVGCEFGTTTSRPRRCGWLDLVVVRRAVRLNSLDGLLVTKIDVLADIGPLKACVDYEIHDKRIEGFPADLSDLARCRPVYRELPGWSSPELAAAIERMASRRGKDAPGSAKDYTTLPGALRGYVQFIADDTGASVDIVSVGPGRLETFDLRSSPVSPCGR